MILHWFIFIIQKFIDMNENITEAFVLTGWNTDNLKRDGLDYWPRQYKIQFPIEVLTTGETGGYKYDIPIVSTGPNVLVGDFALTYFHYTKIN
jgi:hypothetical protein